MKGGVGATFLNANVGNVVDYDDLKAAFTEDTDGNPDAIAFNCESCRSVSVRVCGCGWVVGVVGVGVEGGGSLNMAGHTTPNRTTIA